MYEIERNVPINRDKSGDKRRRWDFPLADMAVGDSFLVPTTRGVDRDIFRSRVSVALCRQAKTVKGEFTSRMMKNGVRIWRVA